MLIVAARIEYGDAHTENERLIMQGNTDDSLLSITLESVHTIEIPDYRCFHEHVNGDGRCTFFFVHQSRDISGMGKTFSETT